MSPNETFSTTLPAIQARAIAHHTERLGRPMTQVERDAIAERAAVTAKRDARYALWLEKQKTTRFGWKGF